MLDCQKHLFSLLEEVTYLNCATMSAQLRSVEQIGIENLQKKNNPYLIEAAHFFSDREVLKKRFAKLTDVPDPLSIAIIPSVSYGISTAARNIAFNKGDEIIVLDEQFPSNFYMWKQLEKEMGVVVTTITAPPIGAGRGTLWNEAILNAISNRTKVVSIPHVHWTDGTLFDLKSIRDRTNRVNAYLIIDGTQSVGALPFSVREIKPDALICAGYKWLMGAYGLGVAYFGNRFNNGAPIENNWMNHVGSENFSNLVKYNEDFKPKASRYDMGESSNFILTPMLSEAIRQLLEWTPAGIQDYCKSISEDVLPILRDRGYFVEDSASRGQHLFGIYLPKNASMDILKKKIADNNIYVSYRGQAIRVAPNVYNTKEDLEKLISCFI